MKKNIIVFLFLISTPLWSGQNFPYAFFKSTLASTGITNFGSYRAYSDGTYASTCDKYKNPTAPYAYSGATGDGVYRIRISSTNYDVYCLMTYNTYGWVRVSAMYPSVRTTPIDNTSYSSSSNYNAGPLIGVYPFASNTSLLHLNHTGACLNKVRSNGYTLNASGTTQSFNDATARGFNSFYGGATDQAIYDKGSAKFVIDIYNFTTNYSTGWMPNLSGVQGHYFNDYNAGTYTTCPTTDYMYYYFR